MRLLGALLLSAALIGGAHAQSGPGLLPAFNVVGNPTGAPGAPTAFPLFSTANVWSALQNLNGGIGCTVSSGLTPLCLSSSQAPTGSAGAGLFALNQIVTTGDTAQTTNQGILLEVGYNFGGASMTGFRTGLYAAVNQTATTGNTSASGINGNYVGLLANGFGTANDNGTVSSCTSSSPATCRGSMFGANIVAELHAGATFWSNLSALELNTNVYSGASVWAKTGLQISASATDLTQGLQFDAAIHLYNQGASNPGWKDGILFSTLAGVGFFPVSSSGTILAGVLGTVANGIDFSGMTSIAGCAFKSLGSFCVDGSGDITTAGFIQINGIQQILHATAIPSGGSSLLGFTFFSTAGFGMYGGTGAPSLSAAQGSIYLRNDGGAGTLLYVNTTGSTTWAPIPSGVGVTTVCTITAGNTYTFTNGILTTKGTNCT